MARLSDPAPVGRPAEPNGRGDTSDSADLKPGRAALNGNPVAFVQRHLGQGLTLVLATALAVIVLAPLVAFYSRALSDGGAPIRGLADIPNLTAILTTTIVLAVGCTAVAAVLAVGLALLVMRTPMRWRGVAAFLPQLALVVPPVAMIIGWTFVFAPRVGYGNVLLRKLPFFDQMDQGPVNIYSLLAIVLITGLDLAGIVFALVYARLNEISGNLTAAARLSGANALRTFMTVTLPLLRPALVAGLVVAFLLGLGQFTAPLLLGGPAGLDVLATEIFRMREQYPVDYGATAALGLPLLIVGILSIVLQRRVVGDQRKYVTQAGGTGSSTRSSKAAFPLILGYAVITTGIPLVAIAGVAFSPYWSGDLIPASLTTEHVDATLSNPQVAEAIVNSLTTSSLAAALVLPLGFLGALVMSGIVKAPWLVHVILDVTFQSPLVVPRALLGLAVLFVFLRPPFSLYGTLLLFVIGYAFIVLPFALRSQYSSLISVHPSLFEAARVCGANELRTIAAIALPLARRGMAASLAIMLILLSHDFAVSVMLRSPGNHVMGTVIYEFWETGSFPQVAVMALVMSAVTAALLGMTIWIGGKRALSSI